VLNRVSSATSSTDAVHLTPAESARVLRRGRAASVESGLRSTEMVTVVAPRRRSSDEAAAGSRLTLAPAGASAAVDLAPAPGLALQLRRSRLPRLVDAQRAMNLVVGVTALVASLPVLLAIAVLIKLDSRGPVLYRQERVGLDRRGFGTIDGRRTRDLGGKVFTIYKFRSMHVDAESESGAVWATEADPRVTRIGRHLRRYRLDELPQLLNVIRGEMNIVGPRPERPTIFADLRQVIPEYPLRQRAKPGITGLAQINHHYDRTVDDVRTKLRYDLEYVGRHSIWVDLLIMCKTIPAVLLRRGGW
jgi:lipopolysaccharide/colanic/teichoic acid biosynthesis glycosyltransferase